MTRMVLTIEITPKGRDTTCLNIAFVLITILCSRTYSNTHVFTLTTMLAAMIDTIEQLC